MKAPAYPRNEAERIAVLRDLLILDTEPEARFDAEIALVSLIDPRPRRLEEEEREYLALLHP